MCGVLSNRFCQLIIWLVLNPLHHRWIIVPAFMRAGTLSLFLPSPREGWRGRERIADGHDGARDIKLCTKPKGTDVTSHGGMSSINQGKKLRIRFGGCGVADGAGFRRMTGGDKAPMKVEVWVGRGGSRVVVADDSTSACWRWPMIQPGNGRGGAASVLLFPPSVRLAAVLFFPSSSSPLWWTPVD